MIQKVGRYTLALALIILGGVLIFDNLHGTRVTGFVAHLWPALLILLGIEWLFFAARLPEGERVRVDGGAIAGIVIVALIASAVGATWRIPGRNVNFNFRGPEIVIPPIPSIPPIPNPFNTVSDEITKTYDGDAALLKDLAVNASSGNIIVTRGDQFKIEMRVRTYGRNRQDAARNAQDFELKVTPGATTQVHPEWPAGFSRFDLEFRIVAPAAANLRLETSSGNISVRGMDGTVYAQSSSGNVEVDGVKGNVDLRASSGNITASNVGGDAVVTASSGNVTARSVKGRVRANATSGTVRVDEPLGAVSAQSSSGSVNVTATTVGGDYDLAASSGHVQLNIPASASVTVSARATSGNVSGPSWLTIGEGRNSGTGSNQGGTYRVTIQTSSGGIDIGAR
ncbi:MAG TPA: DUF4097 family beta strand repeat-containing protein [Symbiobacteriaceae bacterium]|jgi:hypothetical protein